MTGAPQVAPGAHGHTLQGAAIEGLVAGGMQGEARAQYYRELGDRTVIARDGTKATRLGSETVAQHGGRMEGDFAKSYYDAFAPGTSQWERLGKPAPGGESGSAAMQAANQRKIAEEQRRNQQNMQERELQTRLEVARLNANAQVKVAEIGSGPGHRQATMGEQRLPVEQERMKTETELTRLKQVSEKAGLGRIAAEIDNLTSTARWKDTAKVMNEMETWLKSLSARELAETFDARVEHTNFQVPEQKARFIEKAIDMTGKVAAGYLTWQGLKAGIGAALRMHPLGRAAAGAASVAGAVKSAAQRKQAQEALRKSGMGSTTPTSRYGPRAPR